MSEKVVEHFIKPLRSMFGDPPGDDPKQALKIYIQSLDKYSPDVLSTASIGLIRRQARRTWPTVAECLAACDDAAHEAYKARPKDDGADSDLLEHWSVIRTLRNYQGTRAAIEGGWVGALYDFVRKNKRLPDEREAAKCKVISRENDEALDRLGLSGGALAMTLRAVGDAVMARRQKITDQIFEDERHDAA